MSRRPRVDRGVRRLLWMSCAVVALVGIAMPSPSVAGPRDRVEEELRKTDEGLERVNEVVREADSQRARTVLESAYSVQGNAWSQFHGNRFGQAALLSGEARTLGARALTLAREDASLVNRARREGERAVRALSAARDELGDVVDPQVLRLLEQANDLIERGRVKFGEQRYEAALRLAVSAQRLIRQAVGLTGGSASASRVQRELERTDDLLERVESILRDGGPAEAARLLDRARGLQSRARDGYRNGRLRVAAAGTREARGLLNRVRILAQGPLSSVAVEKALGETDRLLARARELVGEAENDRAANLLERAVSHQSKAQRLADSGELRKALAETRVARSLAKRALRMIEDGR